MADGERTPEQRQQRTWIIVGLVAGAGAFIFVLLRRPGAQQSATTTTAGGVAPGYGTQLGDLIQFSPGDMGGQSGGPGGIAGGASGGSIGPSAPAGGVAGQGGGGLRPAGGRTFSTPTSFNQVGPGGVVTHPMTQTVRQAPAPRPAQPVASRPRQTVGSVIRSGLRAQGGSGTSASQAIGILGAGSVAPSRVASAPVAGSTPPRNLPAGVSANNARRLGL